MGRSWFNLYKDSQTVNSFSIKTNNKKIQFGPSNVFTSTEKVIIPVKLGKLKTEIEVSILECEVPLLISGQQLEK